MRIVMLSLALWAALTYGSIVMPYPFNLIIDTDVIYPPPPYDFPFPNAEVLKKLPVIKDKHINQSLTFGQNSVNMLWRLEENLVNSGIAVQQDSPTYGQVITHSPTDEAQHIYKHSALITKASNNLINLYCERYGVSDDECAGYIGIVSLKGTEAGEKCAIMNQFPCGETRKMSKYRNFDGSCNNVKRPSLGRAMTGFKRLLHPKYGDGIEQPRLSSMNKPLPSARLISSSMVADVNIPDEKYTLAFMQWAQLLEHDLSHIPMRKMIHSQNPINCCNKWGQMLSPRYHHPSCFPIAVSKKDPFYGPKRITCLSYTRSVTTFRSDCTFGPAEQMNQATHFMDASHIYGTNLKSASALREKRNGLMKTESIDGEMLLPLHDRSTEACQVNNDKDICFISGDKRVNLHPHLTAMHILWIREHNRIAEKLLELNPTWNDEMLYQEARRIVVAEWQHITYSEWLPMLFGNSYDKYFSSYDNNGYDEQADPSITNSASTTALRFFYSLLDGTINLMNEERDLNETIVLMEHFNRPKILTKPQKLEQILRGMTSQPSQSMDLHLVDDVTQLFFRSINSDTGLDVLSMDIQRGRDHGLPPYYSFKVMCNQKPVTDFNDFDDVMSESSIQKLRKLYTSAFDVDLLVGALAEEPKEGSFMGPTLECLLGEQLSRSRYADRYFYSNPDQPHPFSNQQLEQLGKASLSRLICDNVPGIKQMQKNAFSVISESNTLVPCEGKGIKRVNLAAWQDPLHKPDLITRTKRNVDKWRKNKD